jgi:serine/threonine protein kinase
MANGGTLRSLLEPGRELPRAAILRMLHQLAGELDNAHSHGSIHGCLHPDAIQVGQDGALKIVAASSPSSDEQLFHAIDYLSPERLSDSAMDGRSDQFSLAVLAHRMLTGALPFAANSPIGVIFRIAFQGVERSSMPTLPPGAQSVLLRALSRNPRDRYPSCRELVEVLAAALTERPAAAPTRLNSSSWPGPGAPGTTIGATAPRRAAAEIQPSPRVVSRSAVRYFLIAFVACLSIFGGLFYWLMPSLAPKPVTGAPRRAAPAPVAEPLRPPSPPAPMTRPQPPAAKPGIKSERRVTPARRPPEREPAPRVIVPEQPEPAPPPKPVEPKVSRP